MTVYHAALFVGTDTDGEEGLWVIQNGTAAELTGIMGATGPRQSGLFDDFSGDGPDFIQFNGLELFQATGSDGKANLWVSDGTSAGTHELSPANASSTGLFSAGLNGQPGFTVLNTRVLFEGNDSTGNMGLWSTDGTTAGTTEIHVGSQVRFLTADGGFALFNDLGASLHETLWITDGTAAGTHEITGIGNVDTTNGLIPQDLVASNGLVLFEGQDAAGNEGLWISDGTAAGTVELTPAGANASGIFSTLGGVAQRPDFTTFGNEALFQGLDAAGNLGLWVTDYTSAGTHEITGIAGASLQKFAPDSFIVYQGKVYFAAQNNTNDNDDGGNLWVTDGTAAGTAQIHASTEAAHGFFSAGNARANPSFTIVNGDLLFRGFDNNGQLGTWAFNGSGSPVEISTVSAGQPVIAGPDLTSFRSPVSQDFVGNSTSDVLLQAGGTVVDWLMQNGQYQSGNVLTNGAAGWQVVGTGGFTGTGISDVLLQNGGTVVDWLMQDGRYASGNVITTAAAGWQVVGTGDFTGNGISDVLVQSGGTVVDWLMQSGQYQSGNVLTNGAGGWQVVGTGDFTGSGTSDALLQNGGTVVDWIIKNGAYSSGNVLTTGAAGWQVVGTGDFNGTGTSDVLLQNGGTVVDWIMQNGVYQSGNVITNGAAGWTVVGTGDYNGDGTSDVLLQNGGTVVDWIMKNGAFQSGNVITNGAAGFQVAKT